MYVCFPDYCLTLLRAIDIRYLLFGLSSSISSQTNSSEGQIMAPSLLSDENIRLLAERGVSVACREIMILV